MVLRFSVFSYEPRSFSLSFLYLLYWFNVRNRETFFPPWVRYTFSACFVCRWSSSGGVFPSIPLLRSGSTLLTPNVHSPLLLLFWFKSLLSIIAVSLNPNPPPAITLLYHAVVFTLPSRYINRQLRPSSVHHLPTHHVVPFRRYFSTRLPYIQPHS